MSRQDAPTSRYTLREKLPWGRACFLVYETLKHKPDADGIMRTRSSIDPLIGASSTWNNTLNTRTRPAGVEHRFDGKDDDMPKGTKVERCFTGLRNKGKPAGQAARICQSATGQSLKTGRAPKKSKRGR